MKKVWDEEPPSPHHTQIVFLLLVNNSALFQILNPSLLDLFEKSSKKLLMNEFETCASILQ